MEGYETLPGNERIHIPRKKWHFWVDDVPNFPWKVTSHVSSFLEGTYFPQTKNAELNWLGLELWSWATGDSDLVKGPGGWFDKSAGKVDKTEQIKKWIKYRFPKHGGGD